MYSGSYGAAPAGGQDGRMKPLVNINQNIPGPNYSQNSPLSQTSSGLSYYSAEMAPQQQRRRPLQPLQAEGPSSIISKIARRQQQMIHPSQHCIPEQPMMYSSQPLQRQQQPSLSFPGGRPEEPEPADDMYLEQMGYGGQQEEHAVHAGMRAGYGGYPNNNNNNNNNNALYAPSMPRRQYGYEDGGPRGGYVYSQPAQGGMMIDPPPTYSDFTPTMTKSSPLNVSNLRGYPAHRGARPVAQRQPAPQAGQRPAPGAHQGGRQGHYGGQQPPAEERPPLWGSLEEVALDEKLLALHRLQNQQDAVYTGEGRPMPRTPTSWSTGPEEQPSAKRMAGPSVAPAPSASSFSIVPKGKPSSSKDGQSERQPPARVQAAQERGISVLTGTVDNILSWGSKLDEETRPHILFEIFGTLDGTARGQWRGSHLVCLRSLEGGATLNIIFWEIDRPLLPPPAGSIVVCVCRLTPKWTRSVAQHRRLPRMQMLSTLRAVGVSQVAYLKRISYASVQAVQRGALVAGEATAAAAAAPAAPPNLKQTLISAYTAAPQGRGRAAQ